MRAVVIVTNSLRVSVCTVDYSRIPNESKIEVSELNLHPSYLQVSLNHNRDLTSIITRGGKTLESIFVRLRRARRGQNKIAR